MVTYVTARSEYNSFTIGGFREAITANQGPNRSKIYCITGFWGEGTLVEIEQRGPVFNFFSTKDDKRKLIEYDDLPKFLDKDAGKGKKIVARLIGDDGKFVPVGTPYDLYITSPISEIVTGNPVRKPIGDKVVVY